jgi:hypothetical protein
MFVSAYYIKKQALQNVVYTRATSCWAGDNATAAADHPTFSDANAFLKNPWDLNRYPVLFNQPAVLCVFMYIQIADDAAWIAKL